MTDKPLFDFKCKVHKRFVKYCVPCQEDIIRLGNQSLEKTDNTSSQNVNQSEYELYGKMTERDDLVDKLKVTQTKLNFVNFEIEQLKMDALNEAKYIIKVQQKELEKKEVVIK